MTKRYEYTRPRPFVAVDTVCLAYFLADKSLRVLLKYREDVCKWALPGRFIRSAEPTENGEYGADAETLAQAFRESLQIRATPLRGNEPVSLSICKHYTPEEKSANSPCSPADFQSDEFVIQLSVRSDIRRDQERTKDGTHPRYRVISIPLLTMVYGVTWPSGSYKDWEWVPWDWILSDNDIAPNPTIQCATPRSNEKFILAFDHREIIKDAAIQLRQRAYVRPIGRELLPPSFRINDLKQIYEYIFDHTIDSSNLRSSLKDKGIIFETGESEKGTGRPAKLVSFNNKNYENYFENDFRF